jgi:hypothetical protein
MTVMLPLRHPWYWLLPGWVLVAAVIAASVFPGIAIAALNIPGGDKLAHAASYCLLMVWFAGLYAPRHHRVVALWLLALGLALEVVQWSLPYRFFEPADLLANAAGVTVGLVLSISLLSGWCQRMESRLGYHD